MSIFVTASNSRVDKAVCLLLVYGGSVPDEELYVKRIDNVLRDVDSNGDGYIDYAEYTKNHMESHDKF